MKTDLRKIIKDVLLQQQSHLDEESSTGAGGGAGHFTTGESPNYASPNAFSNAKSDGTKNNYYLKLGFKPVPKLGKFKSKVIDHKELWENEEPKLQNFITQRIQAFTTIEQKLNELIPLIAKAKQKTIQSYQTNPNYEVIYGTDISISYLDDLIKTFKD